MPGTFEDVSGDKVAQDEFRNVTGDDCVKMGGKLIRYTSKHGRVVKLFCKLPKAKRERLKRRKRKNRPRVVRDINRYRERDLLSPSFFNKKRSPDVKPGVKMGTLTEYANFKVLQKTSILSTGAIGISEHMERCWDRRNPGPPFTTGGPLTYVRYFIPKSDARYVKASSFNGQSGSWFEYDGNFYDDGSWGSDSTSAYQSYVPPSITGFDTRAWDELKPRVSKASLAQFLYELKDLPGQLETTINALWNTWRSFGGGYSGWIMKPDLVADNFLNHEFGWVPFLSDVANLYDAFQNSEKYLSALQVQNNTWVRKRRVLESTDTEQLNVRLYGSATMPSTSDFRMQQLYTPMTVDGISTNGFCDIRQRMTSRVWAVGSFKFYRPEFDVGPDGVGDFDHVRRLMTLYGLRINPTVLYKITPWTWLIDWFSGFGKFIERLDDFVVDGIVSRYLYIMKETSKNVTKTSVLNFKSGQRVLQWQRQLATKQRKVADSPYGFDLTWSNLSARQWAILGAIGFTRVNGGFISRGA